jgi:hypothetical protein
MGIGHRHLHLHLKMIHVDTIRQHAKVKVSEQGPHTNPERVGAEADPVIGRVSVELKYI